MEKTLEPEERGAIGDGEVANGVPIARAEVLLERCLDLRVGVQVVHNRVAGDRRRAVSREGG